ncbi:MAG: hypothetical protein JNL85_17155 [Rubrivivax sp.]|nr:hypothetical protein [Rubrivivax sp.]
MKLFGIPLRRPDFNELTAAAVMGTGLWLAGLGFVHVVRAPLDRSDAGALLLMVMWGCLSARCGIRIDQGRRHLAVNLLCGTALLGLYVLGCAIAGAAWPA